jgi:hypothetical protein
MSAIKDVYTLEIPSMNVGFNFAQYFKMFNFDLIEMFGIPCLIQMTYYQQYVADMTVIFIMLIIILIVYIIVFLVLKARDANGGKERRSRKRLQKILETSKKTKAKIEARLEAAEDKSDSDSDSDDEAGKKKRRSSWWWSRWKQSSQYVWSKGTWRKGTLDRFEERIVFCSIIPKTKNDGNGTIESNRADGGILRPFVSAPTFLRENVQHVQVYEN